MKFKTPKFLKKKLLTKRQRLVIGVIFSSILLFSVEHFIGKSGIYLVFFIALLTDVFLYWALNNDLKENFSPQVFILPLIFTIAFGLFYLLVPARLIIKISLTTIYALGLYSVYLSQNIFTVSSIRTIALLSSARTVSLVITLLSYFFIINVIFSFHLNVIFTILFVSLVSFLLIMQSIWNYTLDKKLREGIVWGLLLTICIAQISFLLWFWPSTPTVVSLFLTGFLYIILGLSHLWFEKRLFKSVLWEYIWVGVAVTFVLVAFTSWT